jgi:uncharacterized protein (TIGR03790 family)
MWKNSARLLLSYTAILLLPMGPNLNAAIESKNVLILANESIAESVDLANYYAQQRTIPAENILLLPLSRNEVISWDEYVRTLYEPLKRQLADKERLKWIPDSPVAVDSWGRSTGMMLSHSVDALVMMKGVPLRIQNDPARINEGTTQAYADYVNERLPFTPEQLVGLKVPFFLKTEACVDSELATLAMGNTPVLGWVPNPLSTEMHRAITSTVIRVVRLDGPDEASVRSMIDGAQIAEKQGLRGRVYLDSGGPYPQGEGWIRQINNWFAQTEWDLSFDEKKSIFDTEDRFDAPALYFGWYTSNISGPMANPMFQFPAGAIAVHIHSSSAHSLRQVERQWAAPLLKRGVAATLGNVYEPSLQFTHHLDRFIASLKSGDTFAEAAYRSIVGLSWQGVALGDPLYRPFKRTLPEILERIHKSDTTSKGDSYAVMRMLTLCKQQNRPQDYAFWKNQGLMKCPSIALYFQLAKDCFERDEKEEGERYLHMIVRLNGFDSDEWGLIKSISQYAASKELYAIAISLGGIFRTQVPAGLSVKIDFLKQLQEWAILDGNGPLEAELKALIQAVELPQSSMPKAVEK